jgi:hypothetical protein
MVWQNELERWSVKRFASLVKDFQIGLDPNLRCLSTNNRQGWPGTKALVYLATPSLILLQEARALVHNKPCQPSVFIIFE